MAPSGYVADSSFFEILELLHIKISDFDKDLLKKRFSHPCEARIDYKPALAALTVNFSAENPLDGFWVFRDTGKNSDAITTVSMKAFLESKIDKESQYLNKSVTSAFIVSKVNKPRSLTIDPFTNSATPKLASIKEEPDIIAHPDSLLPVPKRTPSNSIFSFKGTSDQSVNKKIKWMAENEQERFANITRMLRDIHESQVDIRKLEYFRHRIFRGEPTGKAPSIITEIKVQDFKNLV
jgi:hypothetical protein